MLVRTGCQHYEGAENIFNHPGGSATDVWHKKVLFTHLGSTPKNLNFN